MATLEICSDTKAHHASNPLWDLKIDRFYSVNPAYYGMSAACSAPVWVGLVTVCLLQFSHFVHSSLRSLCVHMFLRVRGGADINTSRIAWQRPAFIHIRRHTLERIFRCNLYCCLRSLNDSLSNLWRRYVIVFKGAELGGDADRSSLLISLWTKDKCMMQCVPKTRSNTAIETRLVLSISYRYTNFSIQALPAHFVYFLANMDSELLLEFSNPNTCSMSAK